MAKEKFWMKRREEKDEKLLVEGKKKKKIHKTFFFYTSNLFNAAIWYPSWFFILSFCCCYFFFFIFLGYYNMAHCCVLFLSPSNRWMLNITEESTQRDELYSFELREFHFVCGRAEGKEEKSLLNGKGRKKWKKKVKKLINC